MFTVLTTWISERIITVTAVTVLTVAAVPATLVIASHDDHTTIAVIQPADEHSKVLLVSAVKKAPSLRPGSASGSSRSPP